MLNLLYRAEAKVGFSVANPALADDVIRHHIRSYITVPGWQSIAMALMRDPDRNIQEAMYLFKPTGSRPCADGMASRHEGVADELITRGERTFVENRIRNDERTKEYVRRKSIEALIRKKIGSSWDTYVARREQGIKKAVNLYNAHGDFRVVYQEARYEPGESFVNVWSPTHDMITYPGEMISEEILDIMPPDRVTSDDSVEDRWKREQMISRSRRFL